jgi:hypothetical protein
MASRTHSPFDQLFGDTPVTVSIRSGCGEMNLPDHGDAAAGQQISRDCLRYLADRTSSESRHGGRGWKQVVPAP